MLEDVYHIRISAVVAAERPKGERRGGKATFQSVVAFVHSLVPSLEARGTLSWAIDRIAFELEHTKPAKRREKR